MKIFSRLIPITVLLVGFTSACTDPELVQPTKSVSEPKPSVTYTVKPIEANQETTILSSPIATYTLLPPANPLPDPISSPTPARDIIMDMLGEVNIDRALNDLKLLSGEKPICSDNGCYTIKNRLTGSEGLKWAKVYIDGELTQLGYSVERQDWSFSDKADQNLVARKTGAVHPEEEIYFIAHVDGVGPVGLLRFPAADDNASGVVDLLELARILKNYSVERTVVLLFTTGEERGTLGIRYYLDELSPDELSKIKYAINIDMIGYDANNDQVMELWDGGHAPSKKLTEKMGSIIGSYNLALMPRFVTGCT